MTDFAKYSELYDCVRFERQDGILQIQIHHQGGSAIWAVNKGDIHEQLGDAFYQVGRDPENRIVIFTGTGDIFLTEVDRSNLETPSTKLWDRIYKESKDLLMNLLDIDVPIIGAVNGPAFIHAELLTMSDIVIASEFASFADKAHAPNGAVPGDGVHVWWPMLLGPNRGRHFLLTGAEITAMEAKQLGFVAEVVPHAEVIKRAWEIARELIVKPPLMLRYSRVAMSQQIKQAMLADLSHGLMLEGMSVLSMFGM